MTHPETDWPINGSDLTRLIGLPHDRYHVIGVVRPLLRELGCPKTSESPRANWVVDRTTAQRAARVLRERGFTVQEVS